MKYKPPQYIITSVEIDGKDYPAQVWYDASPPEPDVGWSGGLDIESVYIADTSTEAKVRDRLLKSVLTYSVDVTDKVSDQFGRLQEEIEVTLQSYMEDERY